MPSLFISYRRGDSPDTVKLIQERLKTRLPCLEIFSTQESIPRGGELQTGPALTTVILVIIGPKWLDILRERQSVGIDHVREEVRAALESGARVVPILVGNAFMPTAIDLADFPELQPLLLRNGHQLRPDPYFNDDLNSVVGDLEKFFLDDVLGATLAGKYTLTARIGEGGMGVVYLAEQEAPVKRTVAVKLIKRGMDNREFLARFEAELQALAVMNHPNIAKVLDAGSADAGRPFFVMEYVKGVPITQYCDENRLTPQERLNLFVPVCNAVQHAHQKAIIHCDLKPSNVIVALYDGKPIPKVIDFGVHLKLTEQVIPKVFDLEMHQAAALSPDTAVGPFIAEQANHRTDARADIYSLGVILYELLTGALPFTREELLRIGGEDMRRLVRENEPVRPSQKLSSSGELSDIAANRRLQPKKLTRLVQGDLDWIVMKCLEKEPGRRYETANQLGDDLQHFLASEPVQARRPSLGYRAKKFLRRALARAFGGGNTALLSKLPISMEQAHAIEGIFSQPPEKSGAPGGGGGNVDCGVFAPEHVAHGENVLIQVFAYDSGNEAEATTRATEFDKSTSRRGITSLSLLVSQGKMLRFHLCLHGVELQDAMREMKWSGRTASVQFGATIPTSRPAGNMLGTVLVSMGEIPVGRIDFVLVVVCQHPANRKGDPISVGQNAARFRKGFVSYASKDKAEVLRRVQMLRPPITDIEVFQDILDLEPGDAFEPVLYRRIDECDIFLLFWSRNALQSKWVQKEIDRARQRQGSNGEPPPTIWPVIIEGPPPPPPPPTLAHLHFNDYVLYFGAGTSKRRWWRFWEWWR